MAIRFAELGTDIDAMEMIDLSVLSAHQTGANPGPISSLLKLRWSEIRRAISDTSAALAGSSERGRKVPTLATLPSIWRNFSRMTS